MSQVVSMDAERGRGGKVSGQSELHLSRSMELLERQTSLQIRQSRQSNERLIQVYRDNNNILQEQWSQRLATQPNHSDRVSGNGSQPKFKTAVGRLNDQEKSVTRVFHGFAKGGDVGQSVAKSTASRSLRNRWTDDWAEPLDDSRSREAAPTLRLQPIGIELQSKPMAMAGERTSQSSDANTSLSSVFYPSEDTPMTMSRWLEETDWRGHCEGAWVTNQPPRDPNDRARTRRRIKSAGPVMSGAAGYGWTTSDEESGRGTNPKRPLRRQWTSEWIGQLGGGLPPIRIQGELRPVSRQMSEPYWVGQPGDRNGGNASPSVGSLPLRSTQEQFRSISRQRSEPYWVGQLGDRNEGDQSPSFGSLPLRSTPEQLRSVSRQSSEPCWVGQLEDRNVGNGSPSFGSLPLRSTQEQLRSVSRQRSEPYSVGQPRDRNEGDQFRSLRSLPPLRTQEQHRIASRQRSDPGTRHRSGSDGPMNIADWLQHHAWSSYSHIDGFWRYPTYPRHGYSEETAHWQPRGRRRAKSADPLNSLHEDSRAQRKRSEDEGGRGQGYRHPSSRRPRSRSRRREKSDPGVRERRKSSVSSNRGRSLRRYSTKTYTRPQPPQQAPVKAEPEENTVVEQKEEKENASLMEWMNNLLANFRAAMSEVPLVGSLLVGDEENDPKTSVNSASRQDDKNNTQEMGSKPAGAKQ
ncbi:uncharacterized protein LOC144872607 [Branchiostoma floridae x Branchiostoma japonicum]